MSGWSNEDKIQFISSVRENRKRDVKNQDISDFVLQQRRALLDNANVSGYIMKSFLDMNELHKKRTKDFALGILKPIYEENIRNLEVERAEESARSLLERVYEYDLEIHNSSGQSKRNARGFFLERVLFSLFQHYVPGQFLPQIEIIHNNHKKRIDFIVGAASKYDDIKNPLFVTAKKSLRERGPQVTDEKRFLGNNILFFFYADDLKKITDSNLSKFYDEDVVIVTFEHKVSEYYQQAKNVISYEKFFLELIPTYLRDKDNFKVTDMGIETKNNRIVRPGFSIVKAHA